MLSNEEFKNLIKDYLAEENISATSFGLSVKKDPSFVPRVLSGQDVREDGKLKVISFIVEKSPNFAKKYNLLQEGSC